MKRPIFLATVIALLHFNGPAQADSAPRCVELLPAACSVNVVDRDAYFHALRVELAAAGFAVQTTPCTPPGVVVSVEPTSCAADGHELLIVLSSSGARVSTRLFSIEDLALPLRPRTLALATSELVVVFGDAAGVAPAEGAQPAPDATAPANVSPPAAPVNANAPPTVPPAPVAIPAPVPPIAVVASRPRPAPIAVVGAMAEYRNYVAHATPLVGGRLSSAWSTALGGLELRGDALYAQADRDVPLGHIALHLLAGAIGADWVIRVAPFELFAGTDAEVGYAWTAGQPTGTAAGGGGGRATFALLAEAGARLEFAPAWVALLGAGAGAEFAGLRTIVDSSAMGGVAGAVVVLRGGVGYEF